MWAQCQARGRLSCLGTTVPLSAHGRLFGVRMIECFYLAAHLLFRGVWGASYFLCGFMAFLVSFLVAEIAAKRELKKGRRIRGNLHLR